MLGIDAANIVFISCHDSDPSYRVVLLNRVMYPCHVVRCRPRSLLVASHQGAGNLWQRVHETTDPCHRLLNRGVASSVLPINIS